MKRILAKFSTLNKLQKLIVASAVLFVVGGIGAMAAWGLSLTGNAVFLMDSQEPISWSVELSGASMDCTNTSQIRNDTATVLNVNGNIESTIEIIETINDVTTDNCNNTNDCQVTYTLEGVGEITSPYNHTLLPGTTDLTISLSCVRFCCPANHTYDVTIQGTA